MRAKYILGGLGIIVVLVTMVFIGSKIGSKNNPLPTSSQTVYTENKKQVLFFYANWCPTCKAANEDLITNKSKYSDKIDVIKINYNDSETDSAEKDLARKYNIAYQHTFVQVDTNGSLITKWNGGATTQLLSNIK